MYSAYPANRFPILASMRSIEEIIKGINVLMSHYPVSVVKIGIVKDAEFLGEIIKAVKICNSDAKIVWDPVLKYLEFAFQSETLPVLKNILDNISLITPNYNEYKVLKENNLLSEENPCSVLIKEDIGEIV
jgi:hydroxymethylpyrimidine/phosphomethylpyrimidine kinase